jgi:hypothetical protein
VDKDRSAAITLASLALAVTGWSEAAEESGTWDEEAAKMMLTETLTAIGFLPDPESVPRDAHKGIKTLGDKTWKTP